MCPVCCGLHSDAQYPLRLTLHYRVHAAYDLIERCVTLANDGDAPITLERVWSAQWHLPPGDDYYLTHLTGRWFDEWHLRRAPLTHDIKTLESRRLTTSHHHNPWFAVDHGAADEDSGEVWFGVLQWSGNWKLAAEVTDLVPLASADAGFITGQVLYVDGGITAQFSPRESAC